MIDLVDTLAREKLPSTNPPSGTSVDSRRAARANFELTRRLNVFLGLGPHGGTPRVCVMVDGGHVTMRGSVRSFYRKQLLRHGCARVAGVTRVIDEIVVE